MTGKFTHHWSSSVMMTVYALLALLLVVMCLASMYQYGLLDLYADQWRTYPKIAALPFPDNLLFLDNGHRPVLANLIRLADLAWFSGDQRLLLWVGLILVATTLGTLEAI